MTPTPSPLSSVHEIVERLRLWLVKRGEPDSGIRYEGSGYKGENNAYRHASVQLHGSDATFVAEHFHGEGARELASALVALDSERDALRKALEPFAIIGEELTDANGWSDHEKLSIEADPDYGCFADLKSGDFRRARAALSLGKPQ